MSTQTALIVLMLAAILLAIALGAASGLFNGEGRRRKFVDKDADGEPDETPAEKARALEDVEDGRDP